MALFKHVAIKEKTAFEFRAEAFNVFNHTEWNSFSITMSCTGGSNNSAGDPSCVTAGGTNMLEVGSAHLARALQLGSSFSKLNCGAANPGAHKRPGFIHIQERFSDSKGTDDEG
jgi:hypothetical protein